MKPLQTAVSVKYNGKKLDRSVENFSFTDQAEGSSDSISIQYPNIDHYWLGKNFPGKKKIEPTIKISENGKSKVLKCGIFWTDDISVTGYPSSISVEAVSDPVHESFKDAERTTTWNSTTVKNVCEDTIKKYGMKLYYDANDIPIGSLEQSKQPDSSFLQSITEKYGLYMKVYANKLIIYDPARYEGKKSVMTLTEKDLEPGWTYNTTINDSYTGANFNYSDSDKSQNYKLCCGTGPRILNINEKCDDYSDATRILLGRFNRKNEGKSILKFSLREPKIVYAGTNITIKGLGVINGKYFITKVKHSLNNSGYKAQIEARKITKRTTETKIGNI